MASKKIDIKRMKREDAAKNRKIRKQRGKELKKGVNSFSTRLSSFSGMFSGMNILQIIFFLLLVANIFSLMLGTGERKLFSSLLEFFSNAPTVSLNLDLMTFSVNLPDWLTFLEVIINPLMKVIGFSVMLIEMAINAIMFIFYFLRWLIV